MDLLTPSFGLIIWTLLVFLVVFFILKKYAWKPILNSLAEREKNINESISTADRVKQEMANLKNENEALLNKAREERSQMMREAKEIRDKIINEAREEARQVGNKMIADAQAAINQQKMASIIELKNQVGKLVIEISEKVLRRELSSKEEQEKYINQLAEKIDLN
ncbi:MAG TPA: F0F1 ATP synthase subunit B [Chitinophagaceae bacterium]|nr:F0F1 ATP synthase subunit B [Chitinophagaceae bacterium]